MVVERKRKDQEDTSRKDFSGKDQSSMVDQVICVKRVTKVTKGGKRFSFSALVVSGDQNGKIGIASGKSKEVSSAIAKATNRARKKMITIPLRGATIAFNVLGKHGSSKVYIKSASKGTGVIAGGAVRSVMDVIGIKDVLSKSMGSANRVNVVKAAFNALSQLRSLQEIARMRGKTPEQIMKGSHSGTNA